MNEVVVIVFLLISLMMFAVCFNVAAYFSERRELAKREIHTVRVSRSS